MFGCALVGEFNVIRLYCSVLFVSLQAFADRRKEDMLFLRPLR